jgi:hypothetical protein
MILLERNRFCAVGVGMPWIVGERNQRVDRRKSDEPAYLPRTLPIIPCIRTAQSVRPDALDRDTPRNPGPRGNLTGPNLLFSRVAKTDVRSRTYDKLWVVSLPWASLELGLGRGRGCSLTVVSQPRMDILRTQVYHQIS